LTQVVECELDITYRILANILVVVLRSLRFSARAGVITATLEFEGGSTT
jgi:hypothetical protein